MSHLKRLISGSRMMGGEPPVEKIVIGLPGKPQKAIIHKGKIYIYNADGQTLIDGGVIIARAIAAKAITSDKLNIAARPFTHNIAWIASTATKCSWNSGTIRWSDGSTSNINAGNSGNLAAKTYIYYNGTSTLQKTDNYKNMTGNNVVLLTIVEPNPSGNGKCVITPVYSTGTTIDGDRITTGRIKSVDGKTYFDLNERRILLTDDVGDKRLLIGYQEGGFA